MDSLTVKIKDVRALEIGRRRANKNIGRIGNVLKIGAPAKAQMKRSSYNRRFHGFRGVRSKAEVPANTVNSERTQAYAVDSVVEIVNARVVFVASFESTVMSGGPRRVALSQRTLIFGHSKHCGRAGVDHSLDGVRSATR